jgi:hypothetical protein
LHPAFDRGDNELGRRTKEVDVIGHDDIAANQPGSGKMPSLDDYVMASSQSRIRLRPAVQTVTKMMIARSWLGIGGR